MSKKTNSTPKPAPPPIQVRHEHKLPEERYKTFQLLQARIQESLTSLGNLDVAQGLIETQKGALRQLVTRDKGDAQALLEQCARALGFDPVKEGGWTFDPDTATYWKIETK